MWNSNTSVDSIVWKVWQLLSSLVTVRSMYDMVGDILFRSSLSTQPLHRAGLKYNIDIILYDIVAVEYIYSYKTYLQCKSNETCTFNYCVKSTLIFKV